MSTVPVVLRQVATGRLLQSQSPRARAALNQAPLVVTMALVLLIAQLYHPELLRNPALQASVVLHLLLFGACLAVPWERLPRAAVLVIPALDFVPIGLFRQASLDVLTAPGTMAVLPVIWMAGSGLLPRFSLAMSFLGPLTMVWLPPLSDGFATPQELTEVLILPVMTFAVGVVVMALGTALRTDERLIGAVLDTVGVGVVVLGADGRVLLANEQQHRIDALIMGHSRRRPALFARGGREPLSADRHPVRRAAAGETFTDELVWAGEGDRQRIFTTSSRPFGDGDRHDGAVVTFSDVTDLVAAVATKEAFLSDVSHELRTPLTSILGYLDLLGQGERTNAREAWTIEVIRRNAHRLERLVTDLLASASGAVDVHPEPGDLAELARLSMASAAPRAAEAGIELIDRVECPLPALVDPARMGQVLDNLLSNAIKYTPEGGTVTVTARRSADAVVIEVRDTGIGMSEEECEQVFTTFFRSPRVRGQVPGVGLGLSISRQIVENHGGRVHCTSAEGAGSVFTVTIPERGPGG